jgi:sodium transport system permease protein
MRALLVVYLKELRENARDRRTLLSALVLGPLGAPLLFTVLMNVTLERSQQRAAQPLELAVAGARHAPNLVTFLRQQGAHVVPFAGDAAAAAEAVRARQQRLVLVVPANYGARLRAGEPAALQLVADSSDTSASGDRARAGALLRGYASQLAALRLQARGLAPTLVQPVVIDDVDVSTPAGRALLVIGMLSFFIVFATLMGGLYVAIDATAGERERGSLEPLLTTPVARRELVFGKILATCSYMLLSLALTIAAFAVSLAFVPLESLGMSANFGPRVALAVFGVMAPFVPLGAASMTVVASFTRSYREAQSWLTAVLLVPTVPIVFAAIYQVPARGALMWIPSLSQHLLVHSLLRAEPLHAAHVALSAGTALGCGALLAMVAARLYEREAILG